MSACMVVVVSIIAVVGGTLLSIALLSRASEYDMPGTPAQLEEIAAQAVEEGVRYALRYCAKKDVPAQALAILVLAVEMASPNLSPEKRAMLFCFDIALATKKETQ